MVSRGVKRRSRSIGLTILRKPALAAGLATVLAVSLNMTGRAGLDSTGYWLGFNDQALAGLPLPTLNLPTLNLPDLTENLEQDPPQDNNGQRSTWFWGIEAQSGGLQHASPMTKIHLYDINTGYLGASCAPPVNGPYVAGRALAMDPKSGQLFYSLVTSPSGGFNGDGLIHRVTPPVPTNQNCVNKGAIALDTSKIQPDVGAIDIDPNSKNLWLAGYKPRCANGSYAPFGSSVCPGTLTSPPTPARSYLYLVNRGGQLIRNCWIQFRSFDAAFGIGNDTLSLARIPGLIRSDNGRPGSGKYLLTDAGEAQTIPNSAAIIDDADCHGGNQVFAVGEIQKAQRGGGMTGIEYEWPGLVSADGGIGTGPTDCDPTAGGTCQIWIGGTLANNWTPNHAIAQSPANNLEDLAYCGFRAVASTDTSSINEGVNACPFSRPENEKCDQEREVHGDGEDRSGDGQHQGKFSKDSCNSDRSKDHEKFDSDTDNEHFQSTRTDQTTYDSLAHTATTTGIGVVNDDHLVSFTIVATDYQDPTIPNVYSITLSDGYTHTGTLLSGSLTINP